MKNDISVDIGDEHEARTPAHAVKIARVVTLASASGAYGGPFDTASRQAQVANRLGFSTTIVAGYLLGDRPQTDPRQTFQLAPVRRYLPGRGFLGLFSLKMLVLLWKEIRGAEITHISMSREIIPLLALIIAKLSRRVVIVQPHGMLTSRSSRAHRIFDMALRPVLRSKVRFIALTSIEAVALRDWIGRPIEIMTLGNPLPPELNTLNTADRAPERPEALFLARLHARKRVGVFVGAAQYASERGWKESYAVVGPDGGELRSVLAAHASNLSYEGALPSSLVAARVNDSAVFVLPSANEPWGNVLATALALGKPVVVSASTALAPLIRDFRAGIVVPDSDPRAVADAVHELLSNGNAMESARAGALTLASAHLTDDIQFKALAVVYGQDSLGFSR